MRSLVDLCKGRYPIGLFYFDKALWTDEGVGQAAATGADFIMAVESSEPFVSLCEKYGLGIISTSNMTPMWWGGDGENAGGYQKAFPLERLSEIAKTYPKSPAIWGDYPVDEPNSKDFDHIDKVVKRYMEIFPSKLPFINLYPNYASIPKNTGEEVISQLGNMSYAEHIDQYVREVGLPYICFDYYPYTNASIFAKYLENLDIVARACRDSNKEMWVIIQTGAWKAEDILDAYQLDWQVYMCLAYGAKAIIHASYSKGWWDETTSCVNLKGEKNPTYEYAKSINSALRSPLGEKFLEYEYVYTGAYGNIAESRIKAQLEKQNEGEKPSDLPDIKIVSDKAVIVGYFKKGDGYAFIVVNTHDPYDGSAVANVKLETGGRGTVELAINSGQGVFVGFD